MMNVVNVTTSNKPVKQGSEVTSILLIRVVSSPLPLIDIRVGVKNSHCVVIVDMKIPSIVWLAVLFIDDKQ